MSSTPRARSIPTTTVILSGIAAFGIGLFAVFSGAPSPRALAQSNCGADAPCDPTAAIGRAGTQGSCTQPSNDGCIMALDSTVQAAVTDPASTHKWQLNVADTTDFTVTLKNLPADYQISVAGPDGAAIGSSSNPGTADEVVKVTNVGVGTYMLTITSQSGEASDSPYTLIASNIVVTTAAAAAAPVGSYDAPPVRFSSYR